LIGRESGEEGESRSFEGLLVAPGAFLHAWLVSSTVSLVGLVAKCWLVSYISMTTSWMDPSRWMEIDTLMVATCRVFLDSRPWTARKSSKHKEQCISFMLCLRGLVCVRFGKDEESDGIKMFED
jgi:hypothetical protein